MQVRWSSAARSDLLALYDYIAAAGAPQTALAYALAVEKAVDRLGEFPQSGLSRNDIRIGLRTKIFRTILIAYELRHDHVHILRLIDQRQDYRKLLGA